MNLIKLVRKEAVVNEKWHIFYTTLRLRSIFFGDIVKSEDMKTFPVAIPFSIHGGLLKTTTLYRQLRKLNDLKATIQCKVEFIDDEMLRKVK